MKNKLLAIWHNTPVALRAEGARWYHNAHNWIHSLAILTGIDFERIAGVVAVTSAVQKWDIQLIKVPMMLNHWLQNRELMKCGWAMFSQRRKAERVLDGDFDAVSGRKIKSFWQALIGDPDAVVVDRWAYRAAVGVNGGEYDSNKITPKTYEAVADAYRQAAFEVGIPARDFQAAVWVAVREPSFSFETICR